MQYYIEIIWKSRHSYTLFTGYYHFLHSKENLIYKVKKSRIYRGLERSEFACHGFSDLCCTNGAWSHSFSLPHQKGLQVTAFAVWISRSVEKPHLAPLCCSPTTCGRKVIMQKTRLPPHQACPANPCTEPCLPSPRSVSASRFCFQAPCVLTKKLSGRGERVGREGEACLVDKYATEKQTFVYNNV